MSEYMLGATLGLNDMIAMGVTQDWATHMIGHELTALHGLTHGATLAIVINGTLRSAARAEARQAAAVRRAYLGHHGGQRRGAYRADAGPHRGVLPLAGSFDAPLGGGYRRGDDRRDRAPLQCPGRALRRGRQCGRGDGPPHPGGLPVVFRNPLGLSDHKKAPSDLGSGGALHGLLRVDYSASRISSILMAAVAIGVPGPKMAAAPSR